MNLSSSESISEENGRIFSHNSEQCFEKHGIDCSDSSNSGEEYDCMGKSDSEYIPDTSDNSCTSSNDDDSNDKNLPNSPCNQFINPDFVDELHIEDEISIEENNVLEFLSDIHKKSNQTFKAVDTNVLFVNKESTSKNEFLCLENSEFEHFSPVTDIKSEPAFQTGIETLQASNYIRVGVHPQTPISQSNAGQSHTAKYIKIELTSELGTTKTQNNIKTEIEKHSKVEVSNHISRKLLSSTQHIQNVKGVEVGLSPHLIISTSGIAIEQPKVFKNVEISPQNNQLTLQTNVESTIEKISPFIRKPHTNSQQPVVLKKVENGSMIGNDICEPISKNINLGPYFIKKKKKTKMQIKLRKKLMKILRADNEKIKFSTLCKLKKMAKKDVIRWVMVLGSITSCYKCPACGKDMKLKKKSDSADGYAWKCSIRAKDPKVRHAISRSIRVGSIFHGSRLSIEDILILIHCWIYKIPDEWICLELPNSTNTITLFSEIFRDICTEVCAKDSVMIGGDGKVVEISGTVFEKHNYEKREFRWIFFGLEDAYTEKYFFRIVERCNKQSFLETVKSAVLPGTIIVSEFCSNYCDSLQEDLYSSSEFSSYTFESLEGSSLKRKSWDYILNQLPSKHHTNKNFNNFIGEHAWRKKNSSVLDEMKKFLSDIKIPYPLPVEDNV